MTTPSEATVASRSAAADRPSAGAGIAIAVIAGAQLMVALDVTIVNIALPHIVFPEGKQRNRALAAYAAATGGGGVLGLIAGGLPTDLLSWRWVLFVNVIIGGLLIAAAPRVIPDTPRKPGRPSVPSAVLSVIPLAGTAVAGVADHDAGIASAAYNMFFQIGGAIGLAALTTVASTAIQNDLGPVSARPAGTAGPPAAAQALTHALAHGWDTAFAAGAGFAALALLVALVVVRVQVGEINPAHVH